MEVTDQSYSQFSLFIRSILNMLFIHRRRSVLVVREVTPSDSARVECVATGAGGEVVRATTNLTVLTADTTQEPGTVRVQ